MFETASENWEIVVKVAVALQLNDIQWYYQWVVCQKDG